ncbi:MAG: lecithin retinol acyltransferase family protein [Desulfotalea sp.]
MKKGDHLVSTRTGYEHHGLYIGNKKVVHYAGMSECLDKGSIKTTSVGEFKQEGNCWVQKHQSSVYDANERIERAYSRLEEDSYNIAFNNCEHFVYWCFDGIKISPQVNRAVAGTAVFAGKCLRDKGLGAVVAQTIKVGGESIITKSAVSATVGSVTGIGTASVMTGATVTGVSSFVAGGAVATVAASVVVAVGVGYGVKKVFDWMMD